MSGADLPGTAALYRSAWFMSTRCPHAFWRLWNRSLESDETHSHYDRHHKGLFLPGFKMEH